jgi:hypothetical protein
MPANGGEAVQVSLDAGRHVLESVDGKSIYCAREVGGTGLWNVAPGGLSRWTMLGFLSFHENFALTPDGVFLVTPPGAEAESSLVRVGLNATIGTPIMRVGRAAPGISVSPDGRFVLYSQLSEEGGDLILVENFR